jgi:hypothetical protein
MSDYYFKIDGMSNDQILTEMETLRKKQFTVKSETPIWYQIQDMIDFCSQEYQARVMRDRVSNDKSSDIMDIGEIDSVDYTPDYSERDTFVEMVSFYSGDKISKQQDKIKKATERMTKSLAPQPVPVKRTEPINNPSKIDISIPKFGATNERTDSN